MASIFSDSWFRVAHLRVALLPSVEVKTHQFRGRDWHVLQDPYTQRFFRTSEQACRFIRSLRLDRSVEDSWEEFVNAHPKDAPSREEVIQLLSQLHASNLLYSMEQSDNEAIVRRYKTQKSKELRAKLAAFLFIRVPLFNPNALLDRVHGLVMAMTGWTAFWIWCVTLVGGAWALFHNWAALADQSAGVLSVGNLPWLYVCTFALKLFHEAGHAFVCKRFGGEVRTVGLMFLIFTPLPYVDVSSSWGFANRWQRIYVTFAGMAVEFFFAAAGAIVWALTGPGLLNSLAFNIMVIGSVSSLLFNGNPLLRFDAYYILSDYAQIPNLYQKSQQQWKYYGDRYLLGSVTARASATDRQESTWLTVYGLLSMLYLVVITVGIALFMMDQWLPLGLLVLFMSIYSRLLSPLYQLLKHLRSPATQGNRKRANTVVAALVLVLVVLFGVVPFPNATRTPGIVQAESASILYAQTNGQLDELLVRHGDRVRAGQLLARFSNPDLLAEIRLADLGLVETGAQLRQALHLRSPDLAALQEKIDSLQSRRRHLLEQKAQLQIRATHDGEWVAPDVHEQLGSWIQRGLKLGEVVDTRALRFVAVMPQANANWMFQDAVRSAQIRLNGQHDVELVPQSVNIIPVQRDELPSTALGWLGGGDLAVKQEQGEGKKAAESFFLVIAELPDGSASETTLLHGLTGTLRLKSTDLPLAHQAYRALTQLVQKRYAL